MVNAGIPKEALYQAAVAHEVEFVLTAHPTQVVRRTLLARYNRIYDALKTGNSKDLTPEEQAEVREPLRREISIVWHTDEFHRRRPTPPDEVRGGLAVFEGPGWH